MHAAGFLVENSSDAALQPPDLASLVWRECEDEMKRVQSASQVCESPSPNVVRELQLVLSRPREERLSPPRPLRADLFLSIALGVSDGRPARERATRTDAADQATAATRPRVTSTLFAAIAFFNASNASLYSFSSPGCAGRSP